MEPKAKYSKNLDGMYCLTIFENNLAQMTGDSDQPDATVQLASDEEATKLIAEFEDADGELCHEEDSIMGKYAAFYPFRP